MKAKLLKKLRREFEFYVKENHNFFGNEGGYRFVVIHKKSGIDETSCALCNALRYHEKIPLWLKEAIRRRCDKLDLKKEYQKL